MTKVCALPSHGDILQVRPDLPDETPAAWCAGRLVIVDHVEPWGVVAYVWASDPATPTSDRVPMPAFVRLGWGAFTPTGGKARWQIGDGLGD